MHGDWITKPHAVFYLLAELLDWKPNLITKKYGKFLRGLGYLKGQQRFMQVKQKDFKQAEIMSVFLDDEDVARLTGVRRKDYQIEALKSQGILFFLNRSGRPVVPRNAIEGGKVESDIDSWEPGVLKRIE